jgi:hypothetical protein
VKKAINIIISLLLLTATFGVTVSKHYCMGRLKAQWIGHEHQEVCEGMESMPGMEGCCSNESDTFILDEDFSLTSFDFDVNPELNLLYVAYEIELSDLYSDLISDNNRPQNTGPPFVEPDIYVQVQSFLL